MSDYYCDKCNARLANIYGSGHECEPSTRSLNKPVSQQPNTGTGFADAPEIAEAEQDITNLKLQLADATIEKERRKHRKLQRDISTFMTVLCAKHDIGMSERRVQEIFDNVREGKINA